ncbi:MAG: cbb3-type cytochrome c oxidase subunit I [Coriobacteriia bacterium]|nr:cbb3-type cytochrome c oxidase subunit I [Coriobacteriia bacterium]
MWSEKDSTARNMGLSAVFWLVVSISLGILMASEFIAPDLFAGISWLTFTRLRPTHVNGLAFGFLSMAMISGWYYMVPRLTKADIHSEKLGNFVMVLWNFVMVGAVFTLLNGMTQSREYAELIWPLDILVMTALLLTGYNIFRTIAARKVEHLYVSLWYVMGSLIWFPIVYAIGNVIWVYPSGALFGLNDAIWGWFYGHNILGLWFTTGSVPVIYFILPKETKTPLYGYTLALIAFWFLAFFYSGVGTHHILQAPVPEWLKTISVICSMGLLIPVFAFIINVFMTMRGSWRTLYYSIPLRFVISGAAFYMLVSFQGATQALREVNSYIHFTNWSVAHAHLALLGFVGYTMMGLIYYIMPRLCRTDGRCVLYSERLAWVHWWLTTIGFLGFFLVLTAAGLVQAGGFQEGLPAIEILPGIRGLWIGRAVCGAMIITAQYIFAYNIFRTWRGEQSSREVEAMAANDAVAAATEA